MPSTRSRSTNKPEGKLGLSSMYSTVMHEKMSAGPVGLLLFACMFACVLLLHDLLDYSPVLWILVSIAVTVVVFILVNVIRGKILQYVAAQKAAEEQNRKEG